MRGKSAVCAALLVALAGCSGTVDSEYRPAMLMLPQGDPDAGRLAFVELQCTTCHRVHGESGLPQPVGTTHGPVLCSGATEENSGSLATSIIAPSHRMSAGLRGDDGLSPMGDFSEAMTVRQFIDVVAYLESRAPREVAQSFPSRE